MRKAFYGATILFVASIVLKTPQSVQIMLGVAALAIFAYWAFCSLARD